MEIKYKPSLWWSGGITSGLLLMFILVLPNLIDDPIYHTWTFSNVVGDFSVIFIPVFLSLDVMFGFYVTLERDSVEPITLFGKNVF